MEPAWWHLTVYLIDEEAEIITLNSFWRNFNFDPKSVNKKLKEKLVSENRRLLYARRKTAVLLETLSGRRPAFVRTIALLLTGWLT